MQDFIWRAGRWIFGLALFAAAAYFIKVQLIDAYRPRVVSIDSALPFFFKASESVFWRWYFGLLLLAVGTGGWAFHRLGRWRTIEPEVAEENEALDPAWARVIAELSPGPETLIYLAFAPKDEQVDALLRASGLGATAIAPEFETDPSAPLRAYATEEGLVIWCGGRPSRTAAHVSEALDRIAAGNPRLRGVMAVFPASVLDGTAASEWTSTFRAAAREVAARSAVRCPLVVIVSGMDQEPGFLEFVGRMPTKFRDFNRFGFSVSRGDRSATTAALRAEYDTLIQWYDRTSLKMLCDHPTAQEGNARLHALGLRLRRWRGRLLATLETLASLDDADPLELTGCYFVADGDDPSAWACAAPAVQGQVVGNPNSARWSRAAVEADRGRRRQAAWVAELGLLGVALIWTYTLRNLEHTHPITWMALAATAGAWIWSLWEWYRLARNPKRGR